MIKSLDLGSGPNPRNPFNADEVYGVDIGQRAGQLSNIINADLAIEPIPFDSGNFDFVTAYDLADLSTKCNTG